MKQVAKLSMIVWLGAMLMACLPGCSSDHANAVSSISLGNDRDEVIGLLNALDAKDFSSGMQVQLKKGQSQADLKEWMWSVPGYEVILETRFSEGRLTGLNFWDATTLQPVYHHAQPYLKIESIDFEADSMAYDVVVIEIVE